MPQEEVDSGFLEAALSRHHLPERLLEGFPVPFKDCFIVFASLPRPIEHIVPDKVDGCERLSEPIQGGENLLRVVLVVKLDHDNPETCKKPAEDGLEAHLSGWLLGFCIRNELSYRLNKIPIGGEEPRG